MHHGFFPVVVPVVSLILLVTLQTDPTGVCTGTFHLHRHYFTTRVWSISNFFFLT